MWIDPPATISAPEARPDPENRNVTVGVEHGLPGPEGIAMVRVEAGAACAASLFGEIAFQIRKVWPTIRFCAEKRLRHVGVKDGGGCTSETGDANVPHPHGGQEELELRLGGLERGHVEDDGAAEKKPGEFFVSASKSLSQSRMGTTV